MLLSLVVCLSVYVNEITQRLCMDLGGFWLTEQLLSIIGITFQITLSS